MILLAYVLSIMGTTAAIGWLLLLRSKEGRSFRALDVLVVTVLPVIPVMNLLFLMVFLFMVMGVYITRDT